MRSLVKILILISFTTVFALAEERGPRDKEDNDDHDDGAPIQAGYAVITPTGGASTGLVAFETFGLRGHGNNNGTSQAGVLPPGLTGSAILFVESSGRLSKNLGVSIVNPNSSDVNVIMTLRKSDGTQVTTTSVAVPSHQQVSKFITELFSNQASLTTDFSGTLVLTSPLPVSVIGLRFRGANFSTLPVTSLSNVITALPIISTGVGGPGAILLPQFAAGGGWATEVILANTGSSSLTVRVDLFKEGGTALQTALNGQTTSSFMNLTIPAGGVITLAPRDHNGDDDF